MMIYWGKRNFYKEKCKSFCSYL